MKRIKKITALLLCLLMVITAMPLTALAEDERPTDPALIADEDKFTDYEYDFELNQDLQTVEEGLIFQWNHITKTLYVDGVEPETTYNWFNFNYYKFYLYNEEEREQEIEYGNYELGCWDCLSFEGYYIEHLVIGNNITFIENIDLSGLSTLVDITAAEDHPGIRIVNCVGFFSENYDRQEDHRISQVDVSAGRRNRDADDGSRHKNERGK